MDAFQNADNQGQDGPPEDGGLLIPLGLASAIYSHFAMSGDEADLLAGAIADANTATYETVARAELTRWGQPFPFSLRNSEVRRTLEREAVQSAKSIRATFNSELKNAIMTLRDKNPGASQSELLQGLQSWFSNRQNYKGTSVAITEAYKTQQRATLDFYDKSGLGNRARFIFGGSLKCPICAQVAVGNPHTMEQARSLPAPIHVNCGDAWTAELDGGFPKFGQLWTGK